MLAVGQALQIAGLVMLSALDPGWTVAASVAWVVAAQGIAGLAKDFTKTASKSAIKATSAEGAGQLFKWVAYFTGSKNAMKGIGFFVGGLLLDVAGVQAGAVADGGADRRHFVAGLAVPAAPARQGEVVEDHARAFRKSRGVNLLAAARIFMFGARESGSWSACRSSSTPAAGASSRSAASSRPGRSATASIQASRLSLVARSADGLSREVPACPAMGGSLAAVPMALALHAARLQSLGRPDLVVVAGLALFGLPFAINSSLHSYLILAYAGFGEGRRRCRLLLCRQCRRPLDRHLAVRAAL